MITAQELEAAKARGRAASTTEPRAVSVSCQVGRVEMHLGGGAVEGLRVSFPARALPFLAHATDEELAQVRCLPGGDALEWPQMGEIVAVRGLLEQLTGLRSLSAMQKRGGSARTTAKAAAARSNGAKGGRPRKSVAA